MLLKDNRVSAVVPVKNLERAKKFYSEKLDLRPSDISAPDTLLMESGGHTTIMLYKRENGTRGDNTAAVWFVDDVEKAVKELHNRGVNFEHYDMPNLKTDQRGIARLGDEQVAWFKDTEGNILAVSTS
jgi:predicted enzyme related to lactoylglutathione lyase